MKALVIPDIHLKPFIFSSAKEIMNKKEADIAVCLMDIPDDWGKEHKLDEYVETYDEAISFAKEFPQNLWCYGNHDLCYLWNDDSPIWYRPQYYLGKMYGEKECLQVVGHTPVEKIVLYDTLGEKISGQSDTSTEYCTTRRIKLESR